MKRTKKFNQEWADAIALMPSAIQQSITKAISDYQNYGIVPEGLHPLAEALFIVIKPTIDARARRSAYQKARRQRLNASKAQPKTESAVKLPDEQPVIIREDAPACGTSPVVPSANSGTRFLRQVQRARQSRTAKIPHYRLH